MAHLKISQFFLSCTMRTYSMARRHFPFPLRAGKTRSPTWPRETKWYWVSILQLLTLCRSAGRMRMIGGRPVVFSSTQRILLSKCKIRLFYKCMTVELEFVICHPEKKERYVKKQLYCWPARRDSLRSHQPPQHVLFHRFRVSEW